MIFSTPTYILEFDSPDSSRVGTISMYKPIIKRSDSWSMLFGGKGAKTVLKAVLNMVLKTSDIRHTEKSES